MPRKPPFLKQMELYLTRCQTRGLSEGTVMEYFYVLRKAYNLLREENLKTNPIKIGEDEIKLLRKTWNSPTNLSILKTFLEHNGNRIFKDLDIRIPRPNPKRTWLSEEEAQLIVASCQTPMESVLVHLELLLGFRRIEVARAQLYHFQGDSVLIHGKGEKYRTISKHENLTDEIIAFWIQERNEMVRSTLTDSEYLLVHKRDGKLKNYHPVSLDSILKKITDRAEIKATHHTLRRSFGRFYHDTTKDLEETARLLGHESVDQTRDYIGAQLSKQKVGLAQMHQKVYLKQTSQTKLPAI
ncbi:MAG: site-specific integrase [Candidatus Aenigmatarchaeota archaeon]|nr:MAG: site-specific integrase [Candidatus Aenigmarchaeota archaeon]